MFKKLNSNDLLHLAGMTEKAFKGYTEAAPLDVLQDPDTGSFYFTGCIEFGPMDSTDLINELEGLTSDDEEFKYREPIMRDVRELTREELDELKDTYFWQLADEDPELLEDLPDPIPDEVIFEHYAGIGFVKDDFFCNL